MFNEVFLLEFQNKEIKHKNRYSQSEAKQIFGGQFEVMVNSPVT